MKTQELNRLLLKTAFSVMACDGDIDQSEIDAIKTAGEKERTFGELNLAVELNEMRKQINSIGHKFFQNYFAELDNSKLLKGEELKVIEVAIDTINADQKVEYSEIKFFKIIRTSLDISNEEVLEVMPEIEEFLEEDIISESYIAKLKTGYFDSVELPEFEEIDFNGSK